MHTNLHVLLVDDDALLRRALARFFRGLGWRVSEATDGLDALRCLDTTPAPVDVLLTDIDMPMMGGLALRAAALVRFPLLPVLLMSGRSQALPPGAAFLAKPASVAEIRAAVLALIPPARVAAVA
jgi:CheY-like chemotaxis protein